MLSIRTLQDAKRAIQDYDRGIFGPGLLKDCLRAIIKEEEDNGWTNRETWRVNLWLSNERAAYEACREMAREETSDRDAGRAIRDRWCLPLAESAGVSEGLLNELVKDAFARVDWEAIGEAFRED